MNEHVSGLPALLADWFPESAGDVARICAEYSDTPGLAAYSYVSEVFWWGVFEPALRTQNDEVKVERCFAALEHMLSSPDQQVRDAAGIRVTPYLLKPAWAKIVDRYAGPLTRADMRRAAGA